MSFNFVSRYSSSNDDIVYHITGRDYTGKEASFILLVDKGKEGELKKHINDRLIDISHYGVVLYSGYGSDITEQLKKHSLRFAMAV